jgi:peptidoglycan/LPS O-acetylase OafA/YrhL
VFIALAYMIVAGVCVRIAVFDPSAYLGHSYLGLDARSDQLLLGAALAFWLTGSRARHPSAAWVAPLLVVTAGLGLSIAHPRTLLLPTMVAVLMVGILYVGAQTQVRVLEVGPAVWVGQRAYGIYLYHVPLRFLVVYAMGDAPWWATAPTTVGLTLVLAPASYRWVESPARKWGRRRQARSADAGDAAQELV